MTTASQTNETNTTPAESGNPGTTPPQAENQGTTPPEGGNQVDIDKIIKQRLDRERKKWEAESEEKTKRARMDESDRLKADLADRDRRIEEAEAKATAAERRASLTGKVADPAAALRLLDDDHLNADGNVNVDALLKAYPFLAPTQERASAPAASTGAPPPHVGGTRVSSMPSDEFAELQKRALRGERVTLK